MKKAKHVRASTLRGSSLRMEPLEPRTVLASHSGMELPDTLGHVLHSDDDLPLSGWTELHVGRTGKAFYHDPAEPDRSQCDGCVQAGQPSNLPAGQVQIAGGGTRVGLDGIPVWHSNPGAPNVFYLDFNGHVVLGTDWNEERDIVANRGKPIHAAAYDTDDDPTTFNQLELDAIYEIWQRVSEDFLPFNIDITTEEPPASAFRGGRGALRAIITTPVDDASLGGTGTEWYKNAGGIAYNSSYLWPGDTPVWVFYDQIPRTTKAVAEATAHEFGHALGLAHRGFDGAEYHNGHGKGETSWAPIMGAGYDDNVTQWTDGKYEGGKSSGNGDLEIITDKVFHVTFREDDHGQSNDDATSIGINRGRLDAAGIIETEFDYDVFSLDHPGGFVELLVSPAAVGPNLDIVLELYDSESIVPIATAAPVESLSASLHLELDPGTYYVLVDGGAYRPAEGEGFSDYASLGGYTIDGFLGESQVTAIAGGPYRIDEGASLRLDASHSYSPEGPLAFGWDIDGDGDYSDAEGGVVLLTWEQLGQLPNPIDDEGVFEVAVRVTDAAGDVDEHRAPLTIRNVAPQVKLSGPAVWNNQAPTRFELSVTDILGDPLRFEWNFGDGSESVVGANAVMEHVFSEPGTYDVSVTVRDDDGAVSTETIQVEIVGDPPVILDASISDGDIVGRMDTVIFQFNQDISASLTPSSLIVIDTLSDEVLDAERPKVDWDAENNRATFSGRGFAPGEYRVVLGGIENIAGLALDGNGDGHAGGSWAVDVIVTLVGDANLDLTVDFDDFVVLSSHFGRTADWTGGDFNDDGVVTFDDFIEFSRNFGLTLNAPGRLV